VYGNLEKKAVWSFRDRPGILLDRAYLAQFEVSELLPPVIIVIVEHNVLPQLSLGRSL